MDPLFFSLLYRLPRLLSSKTKLRRLFGQRNFYFTGYFFEAVLQGHAAVEHQVVRRAVPVIHAEIARAHELEGGGR